jgi:DNA-binding transcriptional regulator YdaS (Cro superfamily)
MPHVNEGVRLAIEAGGGLRSLARQLGIAHTSVLAWDKVPLRHLFTIEELTGISREQLRPDVFLAPRPRRKMRLRA